MLINVLAAKFIARNCEISGIGFWGVFVPFAYENYLHFGIKGLHKTYSQAANFCENVYKC